MLETCNLRQALDYLTLGREPMEKRFEIEYSERNVSKEAWEQAKIKLKQAFESGQIKLYGCQGSIEIVDSDVMEEDYLKVILQDGTEILRPYYNWYDEDNPMNSYEVGDNVGEIYGKQFKDGKEIRKKITRELIAPASIINYKFDWFRSIIAKNLERVELIGSFSFRGIAYQLNTEGYSFVEIKVADLKKFYTLSAFQNENNEKLALIRDQALKLPQGIKYLSDAINKIVDNYPSKYKEADGTPVRGYGKSTVRRVLENMTKEGSRIFKLQENKGRYGKNRPVSNQ